MKARIITAVLLMSSLTTFAQTSRREISESRTNENTNTQRSATVRTTERPRSESTSQRPSSGSSSTDRRGSDPRTDQRSYDSRERKTVPAPTPTDVHRGESRSSEHHSRNVVVYNRVDRHPRNTVTVIHRSAPVHHVHYSYRTPSRPHIYWSISMGRDYRVFYPEVRYWRYSPGYRIATVPAYDAIDYIGEVANVYGRVREVYFEPATDEFFMYIGDYYPYQDFTIILAGRDARSLSRNPARYFEGADVAVTGYIQSFDNRPEISIRSLRQLDVY